MQNRERLNSRLELIIALHPEKPPPVLYALQVRGEDHPDTLTTRQLRDKIIEGQKA